MTMAATAAKTAVPAAAESALAEDSSLLSLASMAFCGLPEAVGRLLLEDSSELEEEELEPEVLLAALALAEPEPEPEEAAEAAEAFSAPNFKARIGVSEGLQTQEWGHERTAAGRLLGEEHSEEGAITSSVS